jgi:DNA-binding transcriptional MerR regulator/SAM-dependent methyltransferase
MPNDINQDPDTTLINSTTAADMLSISVATLRNWTAQGLIQVSSIIDHAKYYDTKDLLNLKLQIEQGKISKLNHRRNKSARNENYIPLENVRHQNTLTAISEWIQSSHAQLNLQLLLYEAALQLLISRGHLQMRSQNGDTCLIHHVLDGTMKLGHYSSLFRELETLKKEDISLRELTFLQVMSDNPFTYFPDEDPLGLFYMAMSPLNTRKINGQYFTPEILADKLTNISLAKLDHSRLPYVLDPACGSGMFLMKVYRKLFQQYFNERGDARVAHRQLCARLVGFDIDPVSVWICKVNLALEAPTFIEEQDSEFRIFVNDALRNSIQSFAIASQFDLIIGNPPWGSRHNLTANELHVYHTARAHESYSLFMEFSLSALKDNGVIAFLLPDSWLFTNKHKVTRAMMQSKTTMLFMGLMENAFPSIVAPSMLLVAKKGRDQHSTTIQIENNDTTLLYTITQERFSANPELLFNIHTPDYAQSILEKIRSLLNSTSLQHHAEFALGIVTGNNKAWVSTSPCDDCVSIYKGHHIFKFGMIKSQLTIPLSAIPKFQQVAPMPLFKSTEKLIYRFIHNQLIFAYDNQGLLTLNSANLVIPQLPDLDIKYILAILNSRTVQFYYQSSFRSIKVLRTYIETIPLPICHATQQQIIVNYVNELMESTDIDHKLDIYAKIEEQIFALYFLTPAERQYILESTSTASKWIFA